MITDHRTLRRQCADRGFDLQKRSNGYLLQKSDHDGLPERDREYVGFLATQRGKPVLKAMRWADMPAAHYRVLSLDEVTAWIANTSLAACGKVIA